MMRRREIAPEGTDHAGTLVEVRADEGCPTSKRAHIIADDVGSALR